MDIAQMLAQLKQEPGFTDNVGMVLIHNGVVRGWSRNDHTPVSEVTITPDRERMEAIRTEMETRPGIFRILAEAREGTLKPGEDVLILMVAGDIRENVKPVLAELLDRIKAEAVLKQEHFA